MMAFDPAILSSVFERFPNRKETIRRFFKERETFQTLCKDRQRCMEALQYWCRSDAEEALPRRDEYTALLLDLETEILQSLNESE
jgi:hypothetical protein